MPRVATRKVQAKQPEVGCTGMVGVAIWMGGTVAMLVSGAGLLLSLLLPLVSGIGLAVLAQVRADADGRRKDEAHHERLREVTQASAREHVEALVRKRRTLHRVNEYGVAEDERWLAELRRFVAQVVEGKVPLYRSPTDAADKEMRRKRLDWLTRSLIEPIVREAQLAADERFLSAVPDGIDPVGYEHLVAARLREVGWTATTTPTTGDQGADVLASRGAVVMVVQCKRYATAVGNKAVQEVVAARLHYGAQHAVVVASNGFTRSARDLAATSKVLLLHHDDMNGLDGLLKA